MNKFLPILLTIFLCNNNSVTIYSKESIEHSKWEYIDDLLVEKIEKNNSVLYNTSFRISDNSKYSNKTIKSITIQFRNYNEAGNHLNFNFEANEKYTASIDGKIKPANYAYAGNLYLTSACKYIHIEKIIVNYIHSSKKIELSFEHNNKSPDECENCFDLTHYM